MGVSDNDRIMMEKNLALSVRPGFQVPLKVLENAHMKKKEKEARAALEKMMDEQIWGKRRQAKGSAHQGADKEIDNVPARDTQVDNKIKEQDTKDTKLPAGDVPLEINKEDAKDTQPPADGMVLEIKEDNATDMKEAESLKEQEDKNQNKETSDNAPGEHTEEKVRNAKDGPKNAAPKPKQDRHAKKVSAAKTKAGKTKAAKAKATVKKEHAKGEQMSKKGKGEAAGSKKTKKEEQESEEHEEELAKKIHCVPHLLFRFLQIPHHVFDLHLTFQFFTASCQGIFSSAESSKGRRKVGSRCLGGCPSSSQRVPGLIVA